MKLTVRAPAKINLTLRVLGRRADGFHEIATRMAPLELADEIQLEPADAPGVAFTCNDASLPCDDSNLAVKAILALKGHCGELPGLRIHLEKRIPHGAGLGGGSSDAAAVLSAANQALGLRLEQRDLMALAAGIGSDVPFFLHGNWCDCTGRGEVVTPLEHRPAPMRILLIKLPFSVPTPWAYQHWKESLEIPGVDYDEQRIADATFVNDLERPVFQKHFVLAELKQWLRQQPQVEGALMSGSGSTMFAVLRDGDAASLQDHIRERAGTGVWLCETRTR